MSSDEEAEMDMLNEFEFSNSRPRKQTKSQQIYGVFGDDDDYDTGSSFSNRRGKKGRVDYTSGVTFVSGGLKSGSADKAKEEQVKTEVIEETLDDIKSSDDDDDDQEVLDPNDEEYEKEYLGKKRPREEDASQNVKSEPSPKRDPKLETRVENGLKIGGQTSAKGGYSMTTLFGMKEKKDKAFGKFAGKGTFAERMMAKMGYKEGSGLGKYDQGMINPVEAVLRKKGTGLGAAGTERTKQSLLHFPTEEVIQKAKEKQEKKELKGPQWKVSQQRATKKRRPVYQYKTVDQLLSGSGHAMRDSDSEDELPQQKTAGVKIIDMTGKSQRIITDTRYIPSQKGKKKAHSDGSSSDSSSEEEVEKVWSCPELEYNLNELVKNTEREILRRAREKTQREEHILHRSHEKESTIKNIKRDQVMEKQLVKCIDIMKTKIDTLDEAKELIALMKLDHQNIWIEFDLPSFYSQIVTNLLLVHLSNWDPLEETEDALEIVKFWGSILEEHYSEILWKAWLPPVRVAILKWDARFPVQMLHFISVWKSEVIVLWRQIPEAIWSNVILQLILPKISNTVANWNPYTDPVRVDTWITPWIPILGRSNMSLMITQIRQMLKSSLAEWEAGDTSAFIMIEPWKDVWSGAEWDQFVMQAVVPKLAFYLKNLSIPSDSVSSKTLEPIQNWVNHVPIGAINKMLIDFFFPNMLAIVRGWVRSPTCVLKNVATWYRLWYEQFVPELKDSAVVRDCLSKILQVMSVACDEHAQKMPGNDNIPPPPPPLSSSPGEDDSSSGSSSRQPDFEFGHRGAENDDEAPDSELETFKDLVSYGAQKRSIVFMPKGRQQEGNDLFTLGKLTLYINQGVCFVSDGAGDWVPTSLTNIYDKAMQQA